MSTKSSTVTIGKKSMEAIWAEIAAGVVVETPPNGALTAEDFGLRYGMPKNKARQTLARRAQEGLLIAKAYRVLLHGRIRRVTFYSPAKKP